MQLGLIPWFPFLISRWRGERLAPDCCHQNLQKSTGRAQDLASIGNIFIYIFYIYWIYEWLSRPVSAGPTVLWLRCIKKIFNAKWRHKKICWPVGVPHVAWYDWLSDGIPGSIFPRLGGREEGWRGRGRKGTQAALLAQWRRKWLGTMAWGRRGSWSAPVSLLLLLLLLLMP